MTPSPVSTTANSSTASAASASTAGALANTDVFMQLLVAQLKYQDPLSPADGTQFVTQLAQFSTLEETTQGTGDLNSILQVLQSQAASSAAAASPQSSTGASSSGTSKTQSPATTTNGTTNS